MYHKIVWPMYHIGQSDKIYTKNDVLYLDNSLGTYIIDNKNLSGKTLGIRRIQLQNSFLEDTKIYKLKKIFYSIADVLNHKHLSKYYIDSSGYLINWKKKSRRDLIYRRVINTKVYESSILCFCEGIFKPIKIDFIPRTMPKYLGLIKLWGDYQLYEFSDIKKKDSWRKI